MTQARKHLEDYTDAARDIELAEVAIDVLEKMSGATAQRLIKTLKYLQQRALTRLDAAAAKLGAPYPKGESHE